MIQEFLISEEPFFYESQRQHWEIERAQGIGLEREMTFTELWACASYKYQARTLTKYLFISTGPVEPLKSELFEPV